MSRRITDSSRRSTNFVAAGHAPRSAVSSSSVRIGDWRRLGLVDDDSRERVGADDSLGEKPGRRTAAVRASACGLCLSSDPRPRRVNRATVERCRGRDPDRSEGCPR